MDNYEVNVLTRKGGWKKLPQEIFDNKKFKTIYSDNLNINVTMMMWIMVTREI